MSKLVKFELNRRGVSELLTSDEMQGVLRGYASRIRARCGDGFKSDTYVGRRRANAQVWAETYKAKRENSKNNTILKALGG